MTSNVKKTTLADRINNLITTAPTNFGSDDEVDETRAQVVDKYNESNSDDDVNFSSSIRKTNISLLEDIDNRYKGKKVSRQDIYEKDNDDEFQHEDDQGDSKDKTESDLDSNEQNSVEDTDSNSDNNSNNDDDKSDELDYSDDDDDDDDSLPKDENNDLNLSKLMSNNEEEVEKGNCVRHQIRIWENLLEMRIKLQKCLITSNKMPQYDIHNQLTSDKLFLKRKNDTQYSLMKLLHNMLLIKKRLLHNYPETKALINKTKTESELSKDDGDDYDPMNEEIESDTEGEQEDEQKKSQDNFNEPPTKKQKLKNFADYEKILEEDYSKYIPYRNSVIQKWNDKTRIASGKINKGINQPIIKQIQFILNDKSKIIQRTRLKRSEYEIIGKTTDDNDEIRRPLEYDAEIYDDDDFYHQLLRELIEQKSAGVTDPIQLSKQWIQLQSMRNKMKRKIDTRATKGRRIRYDVHPKLVNFMAPITVNDTWSDEAKTELYNSLFGKIKATANNLSGK